MPMAKITPVGESGLYHVHFLDATDPGFGRPGGGHPDQGLPGRPPHVGGGPDLSIRGTRTTACLAIPCIRATGRRVRPAAFRTTNCRRPRRRTFRPALLWCWSATRPAFGITPRCRPVRRRRGRFPRRRLHRAAPPDRRQPIAADCRTESLAYQGAAPAIAVGAVTLFRGSRLSRGRRFFRQRP